MKKAFLLNVFLQLFVDANWEELWQNKLCNILFALWQKTLSPTFLISLTYSLTAWQKNYVGQEIVGKTCSYTACFSFWLFNFQQLNVLQKKKKKDSFIATTGMSSERTKKTQICLFSLSILTSAS